MKAFLFFALGFVVGFFAVFVLLWLIGKAEKKRMQYWE